MKESLSPLLLVPCRCKFFCLPSPSLLNQSLETTRLALEQKMWSILYLGLALINIAFYLAFPERPEVTERLFSIGAVTYFLAKVRWTAVTVNMQRVRLWGLADCMLYFLALSCVFAERLEGGQTVTMWRIGNLAFVPLLCTCVTTEPWVCVVLSGHSWLWCMATTPYGWKFAGGILCAQLVLILAGHVKEWLHAEVLGAVHAAWRQTEEKNKNNSLFLASITHDLKNPLNAILNSVDMIKDSSNGLMEAEKKSLLTASYSGQVLRFLIGNILDVTRIEAGKFDLNLAQFSIMEEIRKVVRIEKELARPKSISLYKRTYTAMPLFVIGDAMRLTQVLINIIGNAIKFTSRGYVAVLVHWAKNIQEAKENFMHKLFQNKLLPQPENEILIPPEEYFIIGTRSNLSPTPGQKRSSIISPSPPKRPSGRLFISPNTPINLNEDSCRPEDELDEEFGINVNEQTETRKSPSGHLCGILLRRLSRSHPMILTSSDHIIQLESIQRIDHPSSMYCVVEQESENDATPSFLPVTEPVFEGKGYLVVDVVDTGIGMTKEEIDKLFQPFSQANNSVQGQFGGTGLGLWIAKQLVTLMNGEINVRSEKGRGSIFSLTIPLEVVRPESEAVKRFTQPVVERSASASKERRTRGSRLQSRSISKDMCVFRIREKMIFTKTSGFARKMVKLMVLEQRGYEDDTRLEQIVAQLKKTNCTAYYSTYDQAQQLAQEERFDFNKIILVASPHISMVKATIVTLNQLWQACRGKFPELIVVTDLATQNEYTELAGESIVTLPIKQDTLANMVNRSGRQSSLSLTNKGVPGSQSNLGQIVEEIKQRSKESSLAAADASPEKTLKALLADDDVLSNLTLKTMIERTGRYTVLACFNGQEAMEMYKECCEELAVIILDIEMPYMNGIEVAAEVRQIEKRKGWPRIPIVGLTGHESAEVKQVAISSGMSIVLSKPVCKDEIVTVLASVTGSASPALE